MKHLRYVLFDLDGTLIDSEGYYYRGFAPFLLEHFGVSISMDDWMRYFVGHTLAQNIKFMEKRWGIITTREFIIKHTQPYYDSHVNSIGLMPGALELIDHLKSSDIKLALVTSSFSDFAQEVLTTNKILHHFETLITRDKVVKPKPDAEPYLMAMRYFGGLPEEYLALEDSIAGLHSAQSAGVSCFIVNTFKLEEFKKADAVFDSLLQVKNKLFPERLEEKEL